jgi:hypothetical protein
MIMSNTTESNVNTALSDVTAVAEVAAAMGNPVAGIVAAGLAAAGDVASTVETDVSAHQTALATAVSAASTLATASAPVIATLPAADQEQATGILAAVSGLLADFAKIF